MKEGLVFIDRRTDQVRYATATNSNSHTNNNIDEKYIQPMSVYYAAEDILRGQAVSPARLEDLSQEYVNNPYPYVSLTDTAKHTKCLGLAIEPAKKGQPIHIQSYGRFNFDDKSYDTVVEDTLNGESNKEYYPTFGYDLFNKDNTNNSNKPLMYKNLVGKQVFVKSRAANEYQEKYGYVETDTVYSDINLDDETGKYKYYLDESLSIEAEPKDDETFKRIGIIQSDKKSIIQWERSFTEYEIRPTKGQLTVDEKETYYGNHNVIQVGFIVDAPINNNEKALSIEIQLEGDGRGPLENTQWELKTGEPISIGSNDQVKVLAIGKEAPSPFKAIISCIIPTIDKNIYNYEFIALQRIDGKTCFITFDNDTSTFETLRKNVAIHNNVEDLAFVNVAQMYTAAIGNSNLSANSSKLSNIKVVPISEITNQFSKVDLTNNVEAIATVIAYAYNYICDDNPSVNIESIKHGDIKSTYYDKSVDVDEKVYSKYTEVYSTKNLGYIEMYISQDLKDRYFNGSATVSRGSAGNKGKAVIADIRLSERQEIAGLYFNRNYNLSLPIESDVIALHQGQFTISKEYSDAPKFIPGATYYLGSNGNITTTPLAWTDSVVKIGVATDQYTLLVDCADCRQYDVGTLPVGYMKPTVENRTEYGFLLMDGGSLYEEGLSVTDSSNNEVIAKHRYEVDRYSILFNRLRALYTQGELDYREETLTFKYSDGSVEQKSKTFIIPKVVYSNGCFAQIKWLEEGVFAQIPRIPYVRDIGVFSKSDTAHNPPYIETIDISALVHYGPRENSVYEVNLEDLDLHLYVDLNSESKYKIFTETLYSATKDIAEYYYDKDLTQKATLKEDETLYLNDDSQKEDVSDTFQKSPAVWTGTYTERVENDTSYPNWVEVLPGYNLFNNTTYSGFQWKITSDTVDLADGSDPFIKFYLDTDIGNYVNENGEEIRGLGIAYKQNPWQPPKLCNGLRYKVFVGRHEYNNRKVDINNMFRNSMSNEILSPLTGKPTSKPVTGEAVYNFISSINTKDESVVNKHLKIGDKDQSAFSEIYVDDKSFIKGKITFYDDKATPSSVVINGSDISVSSFNKYDKFKDLLNDKENQNVLLTLGTLQSAFASNDDLLYDMFGITNDGFGGINAELMSGLRLGSGKNAQVIPQATAIKGWIPFVNTDSNDNFTVGTNLTYHIKNKQHVYKDISDATNIGQTYQTINETTSVDASNVKYNIVYNFNTNDNKKSDNTNDAYDIEFQKVIGNDKTYASIKVGNLVYGSSIRIKNLYNTNLREYNKDADKEFLYNARNNFEAVSLTSNEEQAAEKLTSALQAAYELPLGLWSYKQDESWRKRYLGIIVEQVAYVRDKGLTLDTKRNIIDKKDYKKPEFTYTEDEINSIQSFMKLITDDAEAGQNAITTMGILLAAARETQERLLKLEASTFGRDAESIPGNKFEITKGIETALPSPGINQTPTYIGLNRIVRALCKEVFNTYDPETAAGLSPTVGSYRARLQDIYIQIEGSNGGQNNLDNYKKGNALNPLNNSNEWYTQSGYYKGSEEENIDDNEKNEKDAAQRNTYPLDVKLYPNTKNIITNASEIEDQGPFNGLNDAMNRVVQKLNVLTAEINGVDNISAGPIKLNQIRENLKTAINELFFNEYIDQQDVYSPSASRLDEIEKVLFKNRSITNTEILNKNYPDVGKMPFKADDYKTYDNVIDLIISTLGNDIVPLMNIGFNNESTDEATKRLYYPVSERLFNIEKALDSLIKSLNNKDTNDNYSDIGVSSSFTIIEFVNELTKFLGLSYNNGLWEYSVNDDTTNIESYFGSHTNFYAVVKDVYDRLKKTENTVSIIKNNLGNYYNNDRIIGKDVEN